MNKIDISIKKGKLLDSKRRVIRISIHLEYEQIIYELESKWISDLKEQIKQAELTLAENETPIILYR